MSKCENCLSKSVCRWYENGAGKNLCCADAFPCPEQKDKDLFIEAPCKMGDTVYRVVTMGTGVTFKKVGYNTYREKEQTIKHFIRCVTVTKNNFFDVLENFGKTVFLTREEAKQALKERKEK